MEAPAIELKRIEVPEVEKLRKLSIQTFVEAFASVNSEENMKQYIEEKLTINQLTSELQNPNSEFYFALRENEPIGYLKVNFGEAQSEIKDNNGLEIERIYVLQQYHGAKIGPLLMNQALEIAKKSNNINYVFLGVWEKNYRALSFYKKYGFVEFDTHFFVLGDDEQTDLLLKLVLEKK